MLELARRARVFGGEVYGVQCVRLTCNIFGVAPVGLRLGAEYDYVVDRAVEFEPLARDKASDHDRARPHAEYLFYIRVGIGEDIVG